MTNFILSPVNVQENVKNYFSTDLIGYTPLFAVKKEGSEYLHMVVGQQKENGTYAVWTCWNETTQVLNHGHYCIITLRECFEILEKYK